MTIRQQVIVDLLTKFPRASSGALGRMAYKENPTLFATEDAANQTVRKARSGHGDHDHKNRNSRCAISDKFPPTPFDMSGYFKDMPDGKKEVVDISAVKLHGPRKALILSDIHFPYQDKRALMTACKHGLENNVDTIILNGDIIDMFIMSDFVQDPRLRDFKEERDTTVSFLSMLRKMFPKAKILYKTGNHEERYQRKLYTKAPEWLGLSEVELENILHLPELDIAYVTDKRLIQLGELNVLHGHEYRTGIISPVNPARGLFLRAKEYCLQGDRHQVSQNTEKTVSGKGIATWSTGCLCKLQPRYLPFNGWSHGFARVVVDKGNKFRVFNYTIKNGEIY